ncbi:MAG: hypothetical protein LAP40_13860 [Acidobacteriia bacterium]|nr:hypothetical protein [Terriglobia bacterium]
MQLSTRALVALILVGSVTSLMASSAAIGFVAANGSFQVNAQQARGNATLFDGSVIETTKAPSQLRLENGVQLRLATDSRATVYQGRVVLEKGSGQLESSSPFPVESRTLRVFSTGPNTVARVQLDGQKRVLVAALKGSVRVTNSSGIVLANLPSGLSMAFEPQVGASAPARVSGCLFQKGGKDFVYDGTTKVALELTGTGLDKQVGKNVEVTGIQNPATQAIAVTGLKPVSGGNCAKFAKMVEKSGVEAAAAATGAAGTVAAAGAGAAAGAAAGAGVAATATVIGGVAAAATVGGLAAAGGFSGPSQNTNPPTSR